MSNTKPDVLAEHKAAEFAQIAQSMQANIVGNGVAELLLYSEIGSWSYFAEYWANQISNLQIEGVKKIRLRINSPGGSVINGWALYNALINSGLEIETCIDGLAASMASVIALAGSHIQMCENALLMIHNPYSSVEGEASEMRKSADLLDKIAAIMLRLYVEKTGQSEAQMSQWMQDTTWFDANEAKSAGFVNELVATCLSSDKAQAMSAGDKAQIALLGSKQYAMQASDLSNVHRLYSIAPKQVTHNQELVNKVGNMADTTTQEVTKDVSAVDALIVRIFGGKESPDYADAKAMLEAVASQNKQLIEDNQSLKDQIADFQANALDALLLQAKDDGQILEKDLESYRRIGSANLDDLKTVLANKPKKIRPLDLIRTAVSDSSASGRANWTYKEWSEQDPTGLERIAKTDPARFDRLQVAYLNAQKNH